MHSGGSPGHRRYGEEIHRPRPSSPSAPWPTTSRSPTGRSATGSAEANCPATSSARPGGSTPRTSRPSSLRTGTSRMRRESPIKRRNPSGKIVWMARYTGRDGKRRIAKPTWNHGKGTFDRKADAQRAIDEAYGLADRPDTLGDYFETWTERHPRAERTNETYNHRISRVAGVEVDGIPLKRLAPARAAPPPRPRLGRPHADERRSSDHRSGRHPPLPLGDGRGRDHRRSLRPQPLQGHPHPRQRPTGEEEAPPDPRLQLQGNAPIRQGRRPLRGPGPHLHRHWHAPRRGPAPSPRRFRRRDSPSPPHRPRGPHPRGHQDRPRRGGRWPRSPRPRDPRLDARSPDQPQRSRLQAHLPDPRAAVSGESGTSTATCGSRPRKPLA